MCVCLWNFKFYSVPETPFWQKFCENQHTSTKHFGFNNTASSNGKKKNWVEIFSNNSTHRTQSYNQMYVVRLLCLPGVWSPIKVMANKCKISLNNWSEGWTGVMICNKYCQIFLILLQRNSVNAWSYHWEIIFLNIYALATRWPKSYCKLVFYTYCFLHIHFTAEIIKFYFGSIGKRLLNKKY